MWIEFAGAQANPLERRSSSFTARFGSGVALQADAIAVSADGRSTSCCCWQAAATCQFGAARDHAHEASPACELQVTIASGAGAHRSSSDATGNLLPGARCCKRICNCEH